MSIQVRELANFYTNLIKDNYKGLYSAIVRNLLRGRLTTSYELEPDDEYESQLNVVMNAVLYGCPELFYAGQNIATEYRDGKVHVNFPNNYPDGDISEMNDEMQKVISEVVEEAKKLENDMDKIMYVNSWLCLNIRPEFELNDINGNAYGALVRKVARCEGYAKAMKLILNQLNIDSIICVGDVPYNDDRIPHAWLAIKYNDEYFAFDIAWNASMTMYGIPGVIYSFLNNEFINVEHNSYFPYPVSCNDQYLFWKLHNGDAEYLYELQNADVLGFDTGFYSVHHFVDMEIDEYQEEYELVEWVRDELSPTAIAQTYTFVYRRDINVLQVYYINQN